MPTGFTTSGAITATGGALYGCPAAGSTNLSGCYIAAGTYGPVTITVPVNISSAAASSVTNYAFASGGGDPNCAGSGCYGYTTNPVTPSNPILSLSKALGGTGRANTADQFALDIKTGGVNGTSMASVTTTGTGTTATGTATLNPGTAGTAYTFTESTSGGANLAQYNSTLRCTDSAGLQTGLPNGVAFGASTGYAITPVAGAQISCVITNTPKAPTVSATKALSGNRVDNTDQFTVFWANAANGVAFGASTTTGTDSTVTSGTGATGVQPVCSGCGVYVGESMAAGSSSTLTQYTSGLSCTNTTTGQLLSGVSKPGDTIAPVWGDAIVCTLTNSLKLPTITLDQSVAGGIALPVAYSYAGTNGWTTQSVTSTVAGVKGSATTLQNLSAARVDTVLTPTLPAGLKISNAWCADSNYAVDGNSGGYLGSFTDTQFTIPAAQVPAGAVLVCHVEIGFIAPTLNVTKSLGGSSRISNVDQFTVQILQSGMPVGVPGSSTSTGTGSTITAGTGTTGAATLTAGTTYTINEAMAAGSTSNLSRYNASVTGCTNSLSSSTTVIPVALGTPLTLQAGDAITCTLTNTPKAPTLAVTKALGLGGRANSADQFTVQILQGGTPITVPGTNTSAGTVDTITVGTGTTGVATLTAGTSYTINEIASGGARLGQYSAALGCTNTLAGGTSIPVAPGTAFTPVTGDAISCTLTNTPKPASITLDQIVTDGLVMPVQYNYTGNNGWTQQFVSSTVAGIAGAATPLQDLAATGVDTVLTIALPAGLKIGNAYCTDSNYMNNGNSGGTFGVFTDSVFTIPAANVRAGSALVCHTVLLFASPTITLSKALGGNRIQSSDQFTVQIRNADGTLVLATGTTAGSGSMVTAGTTGIYAATSATAYTLNEVMAAGSASSLGQYGTAVSCSNSGLGGTVVTGVRKLGDGFKAAMGDVISCRITNSVGGVTLQVRQLVRSPMPLNIIPPISFTYPASNNGWTQQTLTNTALNAFTNSPVVNLTATNTDTTVYTTLPDNRWRVSGFSCTDTNAAVTGNPTGVLVSVNAVSVTIPAAKVLAGSVLRCTILLGHSVP